MASTFFLGPWKASVNGNDLGNQFVVGAAGQIRPTKGAEHFERSVQNPGVTQAIDLPEVKNRSVFLASLAGSLPRSGPGRCDPDDNKAE
ncbi:hypothetical protein [Paenibacillus alginolyticus]|uniref:hypothetical protein n=1 Tax=Paenibacillus alginolyticus TaxID=59839 RepID=UPI002DBC4FB9|nr:hypothetical protein [Paenibacillus alginolyticus]MEC0142739.1 hypothetical protein [Paenibacillus alginolyticus]